MNFVPVDFCYEESISHRSTVGPPKCLGASPYVCEHVTELKIEDLSGKVGLSASEATRKCAGSVFSSCIGELGTV